MLFFVFLSCIPIRVIVVQVKAQWIPGFWIYEPLRSTHFPFTTTHFIIVKLLVNNSLLFREPPTPVFQLYFHSLKFLKALPLMLLLSWLSNKEILLIFSSNKVAAEQVLWRYLWNRKLWRISVDSIQALTSTTGTQIESSQTMSRVTNPDPMYGSSTFSHFQAECLCYGGTFSINGMMLFSYSQDIFVT